MSVTSMITTTLEESETEESMLKHQPKPKKFCDFVTGI